jgi:hypothetical protein
VALGRIWLGNIMRMRSHWQEAINFYHEGYERAKQAGHAAYQAKARIEEARTHHFESD